jgi:hypothetical protein
MMLDLHDKISSSQETNEHAFRKEGKQGRAEPKS